MAIRNPRINLKKLSPDLLELINQEIENYIYNSNELKRLPQGTTQWLWHYNQRKTNHTIIQTTSGLDDRKLQDLIAGRTNAATYWMPNGDIRRETLR